MAIENFNDRNRENRRGKYYVDWQCLDCDLCRETAPTIFKRLDSKGYSYVAKQPETAEEIEQVRESLEGCCTEAIQDDGDEYDWDQETKPPRARALKPNKKTCCGDFGLDGGTTPTSIGGALFRTVFRWFKRK